MPAGLEVKLITTADAWQSLSKDWNRLLRATDGYTGLQSFEFLFTWWSRMAGSRQLWILAFYDGVDVVGIAPLQIEKRRIFGKSYRVVQFIGMTEDILLPTMLFPGDRRAALHAALIEYLTGRVDAWDLIELDELAVGDRLIPHLRRLSATCRLIHRERPFHECPYLVLAGADPDDFWAHRSSKLRKNVRAANRRLESIGRISVATFESADDIGQGFDEFMRVAKLSWKAKASVGLSSDERYPEFYAALLAVFAKGQRARVMVLRLGERPIAGTVAIVFDRSYCSLQIVHDEEFARFSPGTLLEYYEMEDLTRSRSVDRYEFLGGALQNKVRWTSDTAASMCIRLMKPEFATRLLDAWEYRAKPLVKRELRRIGVYR